MLNNSSTHGRRSRTTTINLPPHEVRMYNDTHTSTQMPTHLIFIAWHEVTGRRLLHQAPDEGHQGQRVHVVRLAEVVGQQAAAERRLFPLGHSGPHQLTAQGSLTAARATHHQGPARLGGGPGVQAVLDLAEGPFPAEEPLLLQQAFGHLGRCYGTEWCESCSAARLMS